MVLDLLGDLVRLASPHVIEVLLTLNVPETEPFEVPDLGATPLHIIHNEGPKGFGANHNAAFSISRGDCFAVLNPDLRLETDPFGDLVAALGSPGIGMVAPRILNADGTPAPAARALYTPLEIASRLWRKPGLDTAPAWLAGMFLVARADAFRQVGGFDDRFFMYIEDVDLSTRLTLAGWRLAIVDEVQVLHAAQYASHRSIKHLRWHVSGMLRYWTSPGFWRLLLRWRGT
jgi:GT2 family glycosyltransferase